MLRISIVSDRARTDAVVIDERDRTLSSASVETTPGADAQALHGVLAHDEIDPADVRWRCSARSHPGAAASLPRRDGHAAASRYR